VGRLAAAVVLVAIAAAACAPSAGTKVRAALTTSTIRLEPEEVPSGMVTLSVENLTMIAHSVVVVRTDLSYDELRLDPNDPMRIEDAAVIRSTGVMVGNEKRELSVVLGPGKYVVICAQPAHYGYGMRAPLTVR